LSVKFGVDAFSCARNILRSILLLAAILVLTGCMCWKPDKPAYYSAANTPRGEVSVRFFGTTTLLFDDSSHSILIDGFFSRPNKLELLLGIIKSDVDEVGAFLDKHEISGIDAIFVSHSHYDHALDAANVSKLTGARLYGSESTRFIARGYGLSEGETIPISHKQDIEVGRFEVTAYETPHSPGAKFPGYVTHDVFNLAQVSQYKLGKNFSFLIEHLDTNILLVPSAGYSPAMFDELKKSVDIVFLGVGRLGIRSDAFINEYWQESVTATGADTVFLIHWDDFTKSLGRNLKPFSWLRVDNFKRTYKHLSDLAKRDNVELYLPPVLDRFVVKARNQRAPN